MIGFEGIKDFLWRAGSSFPARLLLNHLKKNQVILFFWLLLFGVMLWDWARLYGVPYLFLDPEYLGNVNALSLFILGIAFGIFNSSFQITTYILDSGRFRFLAGMQNAIIRFSINNAVLPLLYWLLFSWRFWNFQVERGLEKPWAAFLETLSFGAGFVTVSLLTVLYFRIARSRLILKLAIWLDERLRSLSLYRLSIRKRQHDLRNSAGRTAFFLDMNFSVARVRETSPQRLKDDFAVFGTSHLAAVLLELFTILFLLVAGFFSSANWLQIPAGASIFILFGLILMVIGAVSYWLRGWSITIFLGIALLINFLHTAGIIDKEYQAFGIDYGHKVRYSNPKIAAFANPDLVRRDSLQTIRILSRWKKKTGQEKPRMVLVCCSGGGVRAATWTIRVLQYSDSSLGTQLMKHTTLMTGASGGLIGAAYFRDLCLRNFTGEKLDYYERKYVGQMSRDLLNPLVFSLVSNDLLVRFRNFDDGRYVYKADRGLAFEQSLHKNLNGVLARPLAHYRNPEREALIPMMFVVPAIVNDGRRLYISPQDISYMTCDNNAGHIVPNDRIIRGVEWSRFFAGADAGRLAFSSALRMNATFPYVMPNVSLPTEPAIQVMDGGLNDNFGVADALKFASTFRNWIERETSGVVLMCIRDTPRERPFRMQSRDSWFSRLLNPVGSIYSNWARNQDYNNDHQAAYFGKSLKVPFEVLNFQYLADADLEENPEEGKTENRASLSWHLTTFEKAGIEKAILKTPNQKALIRLRTLLADSSIHGKIP